MSTQRMLVQALGDALGSVPSERWTVSLIADAPALSPSQLACVQHGGFLAKTDAFDHLAFGISTAEASTMDPQQRILAEVVYEALHKAASRHSSLSGDNVGICLGIERPDLVLAQPPASRTSLYVVTGDNASVASGRLAFVLGLQGSCLHTSTVEQPLAPADAGVSYELEWTSPTGVRLSCNKRQLGTYERPV